MFAKKSLLLFYRAGRYECRDFARAGAFFGFRSILPLLLSPQEFSHRALRVALRANQSRFGCIECEQARDEVLVRSRYCLLRLHHFQIIGDTCAKPILRLSQLLPRQLDGLACYLNATLGRAHIRQVAAYFRIDGPRRLSSSAFRWRSAAVSQLNFRLYPASLKTGISTPRKHRKLPCISVRLGPITP